MMVDDLSPIKIRPRNFFKTLLRLWPAALLIPFRYIVKGRRALYFRHPFARSSGKVHVGRFAEIGANVYINADHFGVQIGSYSQINPLTAVIGNVYIGDRVLIAPGCLIAVGGHRFGKGVQPRFSGGTGTHRIIIEDDVWIGAGVIIVGQVTIGRGSVIAAGVTLDRDVPPETLVRRGKSAITMESLR